MSFRATPPDASSASQAAMTALRDVFGIELSANGLGTAAETEDVLIAREGSGRLAGQIVGAGRGDLHARRIRRRAAIAPSSR